MNKNLLFGIFVGFGAWYLFEKVGKKDCGCQDESTNGGGNMEAQLLEPNPPNADDKVDSCEQAVAIIMAEARKTMRISEEGFRAMEKRELEICRKTSGQS